MQMIKNYLKKNSIFIALFIVYLPLFKYFVELNNNKGHSFMTAEWLINYKYGFINRGLIGTLFISITRNPDLLLDIISVSLICLYLLIFYFLNKIFHQNKQNIISIILIFSPAIFLFPVYDSQGAFRKEIVGLLSLLIFAVYVKNKNIKFLYLSAAIYTVGIFSHTVNLFFLTTILILFYKHIPSKIKQAFIFIVPTLSYFLIYFLFSPSEPESYVIRDKMCDYLRELDLFNLCGHGSFDYVVWDINAAYLITQNIVINERRPEYYFYIFLFFIALIPFLFDKSVFREKTSYLFVGISFIPLFLLAFDWGRWINIMLTCYLVIYLLSNKEEINKRLSLFLIPFPILFRIEHCCDPIFQFNLDYLVNNINYLIWNFQNIFI